MREQPLSEFSPSVQRTVHHMVVDSATTEVVSAFEERGVRSLLIKGPAIGRWLYDDSASREYVDMDLLVPPEDQAMAAQVLASLGFTSRNVDLSEEDVSQLLEERQIDRHATVWGRFPPGVSVDLHKTIAGVRADPADLWDALAPDVEQLSIAGGTAAIPGEAGRTCIVVLEAAKAGPADPDDLSDLQRALAVVDEPVWREAASLAERVQAAPAFLAGLRLLPDGAALAERLGLSADVDMETALRARSAPPMAYGFQRLSEKRGLAAKTAFVAREIVPTRIFMRHRSPMAQRGTVGLVLAYLWRPLWLLGHAGEGFRAWRRAGRETR